VLVDDEVPAIWQGLGLVGLADIHVHFLPPAMLAKVWAYFDDAVGNYGVEWPGHYRTSDADRIATLKSLGVQRFPTLCYPHKPGMASWLNAWCAGFATEHPEVIPSATFYPEPEAAGYVAKAIDGGARSSKCMCRSVISTRPTSCSSRCGDCSPRQGCRSWCIVGPAHCLDGTPDQGRLARFYNGILD